MYARANVLPRAHDPWLLGWHFEKEVSWNRMDLHWWFHPALAPELAVGALNATDFLHSKYKTVAALNAAWACQTPVVSWSVEQLRMCLHPNSGTPHPAAHTAAHSSNDPCYPARAGGAGGGGGNVAIAQDSEAFLVQRFAKQYFEVVTHAIRRYDPNHLLLGMRGGCFGTTALLVLFASYVDVYDLHAYSDVDDNGHLLSLYEQVHNITGLPILHGEYSYTAMDSGVPNLRGARSCGGGVAPAYAPQVDCAPGHPFTLQRDRAASTWFCCACVAYGVVCRGAHDTNETCAAVT